MPSCPNCGTEIQSYYNFCSTCGQALPQQEDAVIAQQVTEVTPQTLPYQVSPTRVLLMTFLSYGLYLFYWFYLTWKQYRDHTRSEAFPIWHALTLLVPIYGLFRTHSHMRSFAELMVKAGLPTTISPGWAVVAILVSNILAWVSFQLSGGFSSFTGETGGVSQGAALAAAAVELLSVANVAALLTHVQANLNQYWGNQAKGQLTNASIGAGEIALGILGILAWLNTLAILLSPAYRAGM